MALVAVAASRNLYHTEVYGSSLEFVLIPMVQSQSTVLLSQNAIQYKPVRRTSFRNFGSSTSIPISGDPKSLGIEDVGIRSAIPL